MIAYIRNGNHYCDDCVIDAYIQDFPALDENPAIAALPTTNPERDLDVIAQQLGFDRADPEQARVHNFPVRLDAEPDPPTLCTFCLYWFADPTTERTQP